MAPKQRDRKAEYEARNERAKDRGFDSYAEERRYKEALKRRLTPDEFKEVVRRTKYRIGPSSYTYNPKQANAWQRDIGQYAGHEGEPRGEMRHAAVRYFTEWEGMTQDDAVNAMRNLYGDSGGESRSRRSRR